jgi:hypothetical protein
MSLLAVWHSGIAIGARFASAAYNTALNRTKNIRMETDDQRYRVQQNKIAGDAAAAPVFARVMRSKEGKFEGVSFIRNKEKATVLTMAEAQEAVQWAAKKKGNAREYVTKIICVGQ